MLDEHVFLFVQLCFSIAVLALTMIVIASAFKVILNLWTCLNKNSNAGLQFANTNELFNGNREKVRQDYLEKIQMEKSRTFFSYTVRNLYSSSELEQHGGKPLLEPIKTQKSSLDDDAIVWRDAHLDTPINPFKNSELFDIYKESEEGVNKYTEKGGGQKTIAVQTTKESAPYKEWSFKPTVFTLKQGIRTWWNRFKLFVENNMNIEANLRNCVATFLDDIIIFLKTLKKHYIYVRTVHERIRGSELKK
ncbi:hypothetical protein BpHYR1_000463 [Brachionus plicatilis]|uniref:Uncharacterized protein n=1 Tax=Brachionus plicatilis TaxID=10195 RepID=A0A3M7RMR9_BRAPC|nr:hypothetical protein BpHYR1_000463 [Brachionus plicatilis]